jgi:hypothetical protein
MRADPAGGTTIATLARTAGMSRRTFLRRLKATTGTTTETDSGTINLVAGNPPLPLLAAAGGVQALSANPGEMHLSQSELDWVVAAAIEQWKAAGVSDLQLAALYATTFSVADLSGTTIGQETAPAHITIDTDAAGHGWFVDPTPFDNFEFLNAANAAGTDLFTAPTNTAAGHLDLLTTVAHELGHVLGLPDLTDPSDANDLMHVSLVDGERRLPDATDVAQAPTTNLTPTVSLGPVDPSAAAGSAVAGTPGNDVIDAGHGGGSLFGGAGADTFVFANVDVKAATAPPVTQVMDYHFAEGDKLDFSALTSQFHSTGIDDNLIVRAVEDGSGQFATLQVNATGPSPNTSPGAANWVSIAHIDGAHAGDAVNVLVDSHAAIHLAQIHVDLH